MWSGCWQGEEGSGGGIPQTGMRSTAWRCWYWLCLPPSSPSLGLGKRKTGNTSRETQPQWAQKVHFKAKE